MFQSWPFGGIFRNCKKQTSGNSTTQISQHLIGTAFINFSGT